MRVRLVVLAALALGGQVGAPLACFSLQQPPCAFTCVDPPHTCPENYTCGTDFLCHKKGSTVMCGLTPPDTGEMDAASNDADDAGDR